MKPNNGTRSTSTAVLAIVVAVAVALSAGAAVGIPVDSGDSQAVTGQNGQFAQVTDDEMNESDDANQTEFVRTSEHITYTAPAGESFEVGELSVEEDDGMTVEAEISNPNDWLAIQHIEVRIDGEVVERNPVALDAEESENHTFEIDEDNASDGAVISVLSYDQGAVHTIGVDDVEEEEENETSPFAEEEDNETEEDENVTAPLEDEDNVTEEEDNETSPFAEEEDNETEEDENVTAPLEEEDNVTEEEDNETSPFAEEEDNETEDNETSPLEEEGNETTNETTEETETAEETSVTFSDQESDGTTVTVDEVTLEEGGFVVIHNEAGDAIGSSEYLSAGTSEDVEVTLNETLEEDATLTAMAHQDTNDNEVMDFLTSDGEDDGPYTINDSPITDDAEVSVSA